MCKESPAPHPLDPPLINTAVYMSNNDHKPDITGANPTQKRNPEWGS